MSNETDNTPTPPLSNKKEETGNGKMIGIVKNDRHILAWNYSENLDIRVYADRLKDGSWTVKVEDCAGVRVIMSVFGGGWLCNTICRFMRNCLTSRRQHTRNKRAAYLQNADPFPADPTIDPAEPAAEQEAQA